jgi:hypothetical protein
LKPDAITSYRFDEKAAGPRKLGELLELAINAAIPLPLPKHYTGYRTARDGSPVLTVAGLWDQWKDKETGERIKSCTMIITESNDFVAEVHDRMPVLLTPEQFEHWLSGMAEWKHGCRGTKACAKRLFAEVAGVEEVQQFQGIQRGFHFDRQSRIGGCVKAMRQRPRSRVPI